MGVAEIITLAIQFAFVAAASFGIFIGVVSHLRYLDMFKESAVLERSGPAGLVEKHIAQRIGAAHEETQPFTLLLIQPQTRDHVLSETDRPALFKFIAEKIAGSLRRTDAFVDYGDDRFAVVADIPFSSAPAVIGRLSEAIRKDVFRPANGTPLRANIAVGVAACPENGHRALILREAAEAALVTALASGTLANYTTQPPAPPAHQHAPQDLPEDQRGLVDPLTGVLRQDLLEPTLQKYVARYRDGEYPVSVITLDVDYLGRYNEQYGQKTGDMILRQISQFLQLSLREPDLIARCDGDQFVIALCATPDEAAGVAQRIALGIKRMTFQTSGAPLKVAVSGGVAGYPGHGSAGDSLYLAATAALATAKSRGRSTVVLYSSEMKIAKPVKEKVDVF